MSSDPSKLVPPTSDSSAITLENTNVHAVYNQIATHFSNTRYAPWPLPLEFLQTRSPGSIGVDLGCGNGKYLDLNPNVHMIGSDASSGLIQISHQRGHDVLIADSLVTPHPSSRFDFAISIAVVHHFSTRTRRIEAIKELLRLLNATGEGLIYVWALEQSKSRRGWKKGDDQDIMVPWKTQQDGEEKVYDRYYHLFKEGELRELVGEACGEVVRDGYDRDNWWAVIRNRS